MRESLLLAAAAMVAFGLSLGGVFHFDDYTLFSDPLVTSLTATRPLTSLTLLMNEWMGGRNPIGYHVVNLLLHVASVLLLRAALRRALPPAPALIAALIFAVHPIQSEAVNYIFARATLLSTLFCIAALEAWLRGRTAIAAAWFAAALLSKEEAVAFPLFLVLLHFTMGRERRESGAIGAMLVLSFAAGLRVIASTAGISGSGAGAGAKITALDYASMQGIAIVRYLELLVLPWGFSVDTELPRNVLLQIAAWLAVGGLVLLAAKYVDRCRWGFWFIGGLILLLPSSSILPADDLAADRRMYLPMIAFSAAVALLVARLDHRLIGAGLALLAAITVHYCWIWNSEARLWSEAAARTPHKARPLIQLARASPNPAEGLRWLDEAQRRAPMDADVATEQGRILLHAGKPAEALSAFGRALALAPEDAVAINNRGAGLLALGQRDAAIQDFERALTLRPCLFDAAINLRRLGKAVIPGASCRFTREQQRALAEAGH